MRSLIESFLMARLPSAPLVNRCARWSILRCSSADTTKSGLGWVSMKNLDKQVDRQADRQAGRQSDRQTVRQSDRQSGISSNIIEDDILTCSCPSFSFSSSFPFLLPSLRLRSYQRGTAGGAVQVVPTLSPQMGKAYPTERKTSDPPSLCHYNDRGNSQVCQTPSTYTLPHALKKGNGNTLHTYS